MQINKKMSFCISCHVLIRHAKYPSYVYQNFTDRLSLLGRKNTKQNTNELSKSNHFVLMLIKRRPPQLYVFVENNYRLEYVMITVIYGSSYLVWPPLLRTYTMSICTCSKEALGCTHPTPLWNAFPIIQLASVPIREMWRLGLDTIMFPPVQIILGVVDQRWIRTWEAGQGVWHGQLANVILAILQVC